MKLPCGFDESQLTAYWDGELLGGELATAERHLLSCADCRSRLEGFRQTDEALPLAEEDDPGEAFLAEMTEAVMSGVRQEKRAVAPTPNDRGPLHRLRRSLAPLSRRPAFGVTLAAATVGIVVLVVRRPDDGAPMIVEESALEVERAPDLRIAPSAPAPPSSKAAPDYRKRDLALQPEATDEIDVVADLSAGEAPFEAALDPPATDREKRAGASIDGGLAEWTGGKGTRRAREVFAGHGLIIEEADVDRGELPWERYFRSWIAQGSPDDDRCRLLKAWIQSEPRHESDPGVQQQLRALDAKCSSAPALLDVVGNRTAIGE